TRCYRDWSSDVCSSDLLGKSEVLDLTGLNQFLHRASHILYGHVRVNPMLIQQVDGINLQPLERPFDGLLDVLGPTVQPCRSRPIIVATQIEPELGGNRHFAAVRSQRFTLKLFVQERSVPL